MLSVRRAPRLETEISVPGDKSISHRAIMIAALSNGACKITNFWKARIAKLRPGRFSNWGADSPRGTGVVVVQGSHGTLTASPRD
jgi:3-phosphoshikimate 1-carboxyvinyltransferase